MTDTHLPLAKPRIEIRYCTLCRWMLRAAWLAQELLSIESDIRQGAWLDIGAGHVESRMSSAQRPPHTLSKVEQLVARMGYFHFHDTSFQSPLRQNARQADSKYVRSDGSNLAAYLYRLKHSESEDARAAWTLLARALFNLDEAVTKS